MTADELTPITTTALDTLAVALDAGHCAALTGLFRTMARFHQYSLRNVWLIVAQRPTATRVAGFHTWRSLGRFVRRGEKGIAILAPIVRRATVEAPDEEKTVVGFRPAYVFDVAQTVGEPLPEISDASGDPGSALTDIRQAIADAGISLEYVEALDGALGTSSGGRIRVVNGLAPAEEFMVLSHEYAHELLHHGDDRPATRGTRELEAEAVAFVVADAIGLDAVDTTRDYIHLYGGDRPALEQSLSRIQRTATTILTALGGS